jgi:hypothetical protein
VVSFRMNYQIISVVKYVNSSEFFNDLDHDIINALVYKVFYHLLLPVE